MLTTISIKTLTNSSKPEPRGVTLSYSSKSNSTTLLGVLPHGTTIIIDRELIDGLETILKAQEEKMRWNH
jgi:hypothetical protein